MAKDKLFPVGKYQSLYNTLLNLNLPCNDIFRSAGLSKHILKRHPECAAYIDNIPEILSNPDYIGTQAGEVILNIYVDRYGKVKSAKLQSVTGITDEEVIEACKKAALQTDFSSNTDLDYDSKQAGIITYTFTAKK